MRTSENAVGSDVKPVGMTKIAFASFVGSAIEWYDFFLFATASALVFNKLYFPTVDPLAGTLLAFATFGVGFFARPIGGIIAGHVGDRVGRKRVLVATLLLMGIATALVGMVPTYGSIGAAAPVLLVLLRLCQGLGVGGEWGGAALLAVEHAPAGKKGFYGSWPQMGIPAGLLLSSGAFALVTRLPEDAFLSWGWRIPFLASFVLVLIGLFIRLRVEEPPAFQDVLDSGTRSRHPIIDAFRHHPRSVFLAAGIRFADNILYYVFATFGLTYMTVTLGVPKQTALLGILVAAGLEFVTMPLFGALSDRIGRRPVVVMGAVATVLFAFPYFWLVDTKNVLLILAGCALTISLAHAAVFACLAAWFAEMFGAEVRYSGISIGFQLGALVAGAPTPFLAATLLDSSGGDPTPVALLAVAAGLVTLVCAVLAGREGRHRRADGKQAPAVSVAAGNSQF